jgi:predicted short-subunit dehydrogenase-like oxidoreductase (DUF2520 family)
MLKDGIRKIVILGAGRLAVNLSTAILDRGYEIVEVCNRTQSKGKRLAEKVEARFIREPELITPDADLYIIAISDTAIPSVLNRIPKVKGLVVHTSGSVNMDVFKGAFRNFGVIYPSQTLTRQMLEFRDVPICIEANSAANLVRIKAFASSLSGFVYAINSDQRKILHLAAVFANNFTNFMYSISEELLNEKGMDFSLLYPIIRQTTENSLSGGVVKNQTGPAVRGDKETIGKHLELLSNHPDYKDIYELITRNIIKRKKIYVQL